MPFTVRTFKKLRLRLNDDIELRHTWVAVKCKKLLQLLVLRNANFLWIISITIFLLQKYLAIHETLVIQSVAIARNDLSSLMYKYMK